MAKSRIIKELANGQVDLSTALKRAKVLLYELNDKSLLDWIDHELTGYKDMDDIPDYREYQGILKGTFVIPLANGRYEQHTNVSIPINKMPETEKNKLLSVYFIDGVDTLKSYCENSDANNPTLEKPIPADNYPFIQKYSYYPRTRIISASVLIDSTVAINILSIIENKLLDSLILLEKEFGCLDKLDLDVSNVKNSNIKRVAKQINLILYDKSIRIGDNNKLKNNDIN